MPTCLVFKKVHLMLASQFLGVYHVVWWSLVYHVVWQSLRMKRQNLKIRLRKYVHTPLILYVWRRVIIPFYKVFSTVRSVYFLYLWLYYTSRFVCDTQFRSMYVCMYLWINNFILYYCSVIWMWLRKNKWWPLSLWNDLLQFMWKKESQWFLMQELLALLFHESLGRR